MTRRERTRALARAPLDFCRGLAAEVEAAHAVETIQEARPVLVMATQRESARNSLFHVGELMATEARVAVGGVLGLGLAQDGDEVAAAAKARCLAVVDAAWNAGLAPVADWERRLRGLELAAAAAEAAERGRIEATAVDFKTMQD